MIAITLAIVLLFSGCTAQVMETGNVPATTPTEEIAEQTGFIENQLLYSAEVKIHFSYYLPEGYDSARAYPLNWGLQQRKSAGKEIHNGG